MVVEESDQWVLDHIVGGTPGTAERIRNNIEAKVPYRISATDGDWTVKHKDRPFPDLLRQLALRVTAQGVIAGSFTELRDELNRWPAEQVAGNAVRQLRQSMP